MASKSFYFSFRFSLLLLLGISVFSCKNSNQADSGIGYAHITAVNAVNNKAAIDIYASGSRFNNTVINSGAVTGFRNMLAGLRSLQIKSSGQIIGNDSIKTLRDSSYTMFIFTANNIVHAIIAEDDLSLPTNGNAKIKFANMSSGLASADLKIVDGPVISANTGFGRIGTYAEIKSGTYNFNINKSGSSEVVSTIPAVTLLNGKTYTIWSGGKYTGDSYSMSTNIFSF